MAAPLGNIKLDSGSGSFGIPRAVQTFSLDAAPPKERFHLKFRAAQHPDLLDREICFIELSNMRSHQEAEARIAGKEFEVCILGGGATGAGYALDAQLRGLRTVLLENDFGSGTSSTSTKLIHGGVRYLEQAVKEFDLAVYRVV